MNGMQHERTVPFPWKAFWTQLLFAPLHQVVWSPSQFLYRYQVKLLAQCWQLDTVNSHDYKVIEFLEQCWMKSFKNL